MEATSGEVYDQENENLERILGALHILRDAVEQRLDKDGRYDHELYSIPDDLHWAINETLMDARVKGEWMLAEIPQRIDAFEQRTRKEE